MLRTRNGIALFVGWAFVWLALEKVFFGEAVFAYSTSQDGYVVYAIVLLTICVISCFLSFEQRIVELVRGNTAVNFTCGIAGSCSLALSASMSGGWIQSSFLAMVGCGMAYGAFFSIVFVLWSIRLRDLVFEYGLFSVLAVSLIAIAASFLVVPSTARFSLYGQIVVIFSPMLSCCSFAMTKNVFDQPAAYMEEIDDQAKPIRLCLIMLASFSFLVHLMAYVAFIAPGYVPVSDENPYSFTALFVVVLALLVVLAHSDSSARFWDNVFVNMLVASVIFSFLVFFLVFVSISLDGAYPYDLAKMLRRIVKIIVFFTVAMIVYRNGIKAPPAFVLVLLFPSIASKLFQMSFSLTHFQIQNNLVVYVAIIGFLLVVCWSLFLLFYTRGRALFFAEAVEEGKGLAVGMPKQHHAIEFLTTHYRFTDRERDVLEYLALGYSTQRISELLYISTNTVKTHIAAIYRKTDAHSKQEIIDLVKSMDEIAR